MRIYAKVDLDAIDHNIHYMEQLQEDKIPIMAVIKTNGYGHGAVAIAKHLEENKDICGFAVATAEEALELRKEGIKKTILILGFVFEKDYESLIEEDIRFCVFRYDLAEKLSQIAVKKKKNAIVHIKIDTGMGRIGFLPGEESMQIIERISQLPGIVMEGIFTHFAKADELDKSYTRQQYEKFLQVIQELEKRDVTFSIKHCANSAAILSFPAQEMNMVRGGITLYGLCPSEEIGEQFDLKPALSLYSHVIHIKDVDPGEFISYGGTYQVKEHKRIATIPVGYGDGYPRALSNCGYVLLHGKKANIVGRVCMDQFMIDVTDIAEVELLDQVVLIGQQGENHITMEEIGDLSGRFNYELACDLGNRIPRLYYKGDVLVGKMDYFA